MDTEKRRTGIIIAVIFLFMIVAIPTGQAPMPVYPEPDLGWINTQSKEDVTDVAVGDLISNGEADVAFIDNLITQDTAFAVYGNNGTEYWKNIYVCGYSIAVGDVDGDAKNEVVVGGANFSEGKSGVTVFEDDGTFKFFYQTDSMVTDIEIGHIDNDGTRDIIACDPADDGWIYVISGTSGANLTGWPVNNLSAIVNIAIGNLDDAGGVDIAALSDSTGTLYAYNSTGTEMWKNTTVLGRSVEIGNVDSDPEEEVVIGDMNSSHVYVYNGSTGTLEYSFNTTHPPSEVELGYLDGDESDLEIAVITGYLKDLTIFAIDIDASNQVFEMWNFSIDWTANYYGEGLAIGDVDGDNKNEVIALSDRDDYSVGYKVWAFDDLDGNGDGLGDVVWMYELPSHPNDVEVGDVDGDGDMDVIVGTNHEDEGSVYALFTFKPEIAVNKTVYDPINEEWVKELTAKINDTLRFNCTITNTGTVNLTQIRFWDVLDCSLVYAGNATLKNESGGILINFEETPYLQKQYNYTFKQRVLHPNTTYDEVCAQMPGYLWDPYDPIGNCSKGSGYLPTFDELCPENKLHELHDWVDTYNDSRVSACDQLWLESYLEWYHVDHVPYTLLVNNTETGESMYLDSVLDYEALNLSEANGTAWTEVCWIESCCGKDRYNLSVWYDTNNTGDLNVNDTLVLQNIRTGEAAQYTVEEVAIDLVVSMEWEVDHLINNSMFSVPLGQPVGALVPEDGQNLFIVTGPIEPLNLFVLEPNQNITIEYNATVVSCGVDNNTFRAKGDSNSSKEGEDWIYSNEDVVTITVPCPSGDAADADLVIKDVYTTDEDVYALGRDFAPNKYVDIYITPVRTWAFGDNISDYKIVGPVNTTTDANGSIGIDPKVLMWPDPVPGQYHMVFDDPDGLYEPGVDVYDYFEVRGGAAVPLITPLGIAALIGLLSIVALSTLIRRKRH